MKFGCWKFYRGAPAMDTRWVMLILICVVGLLGCGDSGMSDSSNNIDDSAREHSTNKESDEAEFPSGRTDTKSETVRDESSTAVNDVEPKRPETNPSEVRTKPEHAAMASNTATDTWPNWMGSSHDGISNEKGWSSDWPEEGLPVAWEKEIGIGFSSVAIAENRLFATGHIEGKEHVYALDAVTGELIWTYSYTSPLVDDLHEGGAGATPTIDGEFVYILGRGGQLFCFEAASGEIVWTKSLQDDLGVELPKWGFSSSPFILDDQLILEAGRVVSYSKRTGEKNWQTEEHAAGYGSAFSFDFQGETLLATLDCDGLRIVQAADGEQVDFHSWESPYKTNSTTPIVRGDLIYVSTGYNKGCGLFRLGQDRKLELVYSNKEMRNHFNNCILLNGFLYGFDGNSNLGRVVQLTCMDFETGEVAWQKRGMGCGSLMIVDENLLILSDEGELVLAKADSSDFQELARSEFLEGRCWTVPVLLNGRVYGRNATGKLVCVQLPKKK